MFCLLLLVIHLHIVGTISQTVVRGLVGQEITLPCTYSVRGSTNHMCWGRGSCPKSKCNNEILTTDGRMVTSKTSNRYQLRGWIIGGDVSLTIVNLKEEDKGMYCCRIEVPGWFNDLKKTLNLQVDRATTTTSQATTTTKSHTVPTTTTSVSLMTTVSPPTTAFLLATPPLAVSTVAPLTTNVPPRTTSPMKEVTEFFTSGPTFVSINPSTTSLQTMYGYDYNFLPTESEITTSTAVMTSPPGTLLATKNTENIDNWPSSVPFTPYPAAMTNMSHTAATSPAKAPLTTPVIISTTSRFISPTTSSSPTVPAVALPITNVSSMTTPSTSTAVALLTASPPLVNTKSSSTSPQHERTENESSFTSKVSTSYKEDVKKMLLYVLIAVVVLVLLSLLLVLIIKRKNIRQYQLSKTKCVSKVEEPEKMLIGTEGENGLFAL